MIENDQQVIDYISTKQSTDEPGKYTKKLYMIVVLILNISYL